MEQDEVEGEEPPRWATVAAPATAGGGAATAADALSVLTVPFLRKYLYYSKTKFAKQQLTQEAFEDISQFYVEVRQAAATGAVDPRFRCARHASLWLACWRQECLCQRIDNKLPELYVCVPLRVSF